VPGGFFAFGTFGWVQHNSTILGEHMTGTTKPGSGLTQSTKRTFLMLSSQISQKSTDFAQFHRPVGIRAVLAALTAGSSAPAGIFEKNAAAVGSANRS